ncbi:hypothetical protein Tco_0520059 [Tanacetum coccineum]
MQRLVRRGRSQACRSNPHPDYVPSPEELSMQPTLKLNYVPYYPADGGDDGDDEMDIEEDEDDDMDIEADEEDEDDEMDVEIDDDEHLSSLAYPEVVALTKRLPPSAEELSLFETDEFLRLHHTYTRYRMTARISIPEPLPVPAWSDSEVARLLVISSPPASPLSPCPIESWLERAATFIMKAEAAATSHSLPLPPPFILSPTRPDAPPPLPTSAPTSFPPLLLPTDSHREGRPEGNYGAFVATMDRLIRRDPERYVGYRITDSWEEMARNNEIYTMLDDEQSQRQLLASRVNMLFRDRRGHAQTCHLMETEAGMSIEAYGRVMDVSDLAHGEVISLRTTVHAHMSEIRELQSVDGRRQRAISDLLETDRMRREEMRELRAADRTRQQ